jgi:DNA-binding MarR family transcriptional regulator
MLGKRLQPLGLTVAQFDALANLYVHDGISQQELAHSLLVTKGNVTGLVNRLSEAGLVERRNDPSDRRTNKLVLTRSGKRLAAKALEVQRGLVQEMLGELPMAERESLRSLLDQVIASIDRH